MSSRRPEQRAVTRWLAPGVVVLAATLSGFGARGLWPRATAQSAAQPAVPVGTAQVIRTDVAERQAVAGVIGYQGSYSVVNELPAGVITAVPRPGQTLTRGETLYRQADQPVTLFYGGTPAWRDIGPASTPGPDIRELDQNLDALGYAAGPPDDALTWGAVVAIERWQLANGMTQTGTVTLGQVCFLPGPVRVTATAASLGSPAAPGTQVLTGTSATPSVTVNLTPGGAPVRPGDQVQVTLPDGSTTVPGHVRTVGAVTQAPPSQSQGAPTSIVPVTISLDGYRLPADLDQAAVQIIMTERTDQNVLAVPVTALLAQAGGGYAVRAGAGAASRLIAVNVGIYDDTTGLVEVSGTGLTAGLAVQAGQG